MSHQVPRIPVLVKRLEHFGDLELPEYASEHASGMDVPAGQ